LKERNKSFLLSLGIVVAVEESRNVAVWIVIVSFVNVLVDSDARRL